MKEYIMSLDNSAIAYAASKTNIPINNIISTCNLLFAEDCTIPFISRYRKEATGNLDEVQIRDIKEAYEEHIEIEKRRAFILETITKNEKMNPKLEAMIKAATTLVQLEDIYAPYKTKRKTKGMLAIEKGLEPFADFLMESDKAFTSEIASLTDQFVTKSDGKVKDINEAINGACDILMERFSQNVSTKEALREEYWNSGIVKSEKRKDAEKIDGSDKFKDFFEFSEPVSKIKDPKNTHRYLAIRRAMNLKVLKMSITIDDEVAQNIIIKNELSHNPANKDLLEKVAVKAYETSISTSLDLELKSELKKIADLAAINVFSVNLKNLMLQPYLGSKTVLGIDPGIRTGCKVVVIDKNGNFVGDHVIYPFAPKFDTVNSKMILEKLIEMFNVEYIAIGNGTNGRETLEFVQDSIKPVQDGKIKATLINEDGASIYSASDVAREEFPDKDVTVRGAISIARRFQDPLAELVKLDPKSIGVGQYQHDVNQVRLKKSLEGVVENCVNFVGVDLNTASSHLLSFISGIGPSVAKNIVKQRTKSNGFKSREDLLGVPRFSQKVFEQSAGFLRLYHSKNPLDGTFIHPERYSILEKWCKDHKVDLKDLVHEKDLIDQLSQDKSLKEQIGELTFDDIIKSLKSPKQDPRSEFKPVEFRKDVRKIQDLTAGEWYTGIVNNITNFGAFVDIGVKESGLLHISQISNEYVENSLDMLKVGEQVKVKVIELDIDRKRISLSCKTDADVDYSKSGSNPRKAKRVVEQKISNNAFSGLKGFKVK